MDRIEQIIEMEDYIATERTYRSSDEIASGLYDKGYRKADEVRKETAKEILQWLYNLRKGGFSLNASEVRRIAKDHGIEVDE